MDPLRSAHCYIFVLTITDFYLPLTLHHYKDTKVTEWATRWLQDQLGLGVLGFACRFVVLNNRLGFFCQANQSSLVVSGRLWIPRAGQASDPIQRAWQTHTPNIKLGNHLSLGSIRQTEIQLISWGEKRRTTEATKATVQEDKLGVERVLTGSLAVGRNWDPEEILRYQV